MTAFHRLFFEWLKHAVLQRRERVFTKGVPIWEPTCREGEWKIQRTHPYPVPRRDFEPKHAWQKIPLLQICDSAIPCERVRKQHTNFEFSPRFGGSSRDREDRGECWFHLSPPLLLPECNLNKFPFKKVTRVERGRNGEKKALADSTRAPEKGIEPRNGFHS